MCLKHIYSVCTCILILLDLGNIKVTLLKSQVILAVDETNYTQVYLRDQIFIVFKTIGMLSKLMIQIWKCFLQLASKAIKELLSMLSVGIDIFTHIVELGADHLLKLCQLRHL